jgi:hypothetical protein
VNKAFVREPDSPEPRCPESGGCGRRGTLVSEQTLGAQLRADDVRRINPPAYYCSNPKCPVAYFDGWGGMVPLKALETRAYPKDPEGMICACLRVPARRIVSDAQVDDRSTLLRILEHVRGDTACCETASPEGVSCERRLRQLFLEHRPA